MKFDEFIHDLASVVIRRFEPDQNGSRLVPYGTERGPLGVFKDCLAAVPAWSKPLVGAGESAVRS
jgi:hypothetical protein